MIRGTRFLVRVLVSVDEHSDVSKCKIPMPVNIWPLDEEVDYHSLLCNAKLLEEILWYLR